MKNHPNIFGIWSILCVIVSSLFPVIGISPAPAYAQTDSAIIVSFASDRAQYSCGNAVNITLRAGNTGSVPIQLRGTVVIRDPSNRVIYDNSMRYDLAPGETDQQIFSTTIPSNATEGNYSVQGTIVNALSSKSYDQKSASLNVRCVTGWSLLVEIPSGGGYVERSPDRGFYQDGSSVTLTADPDEGWEFNYWGDDAKTKGRQLSIDLVMDSNKRVTAYFKRSREDPNAGWILHIEVPTGGGYVERSPDRGSYQDGSSVTLTADPDEGWEFNYWGDDAKTKGRQISINLVMDSNKVVTAYFRRSGSETVGKTTPHSPYVYQLNSEKWPTTLGQVTYRPELKGIEMRATMGGITLNGFEHLSSYIGKYGWEQVQQDYFFGYQIELYKRNYFLWVIPIDTLLNKDDIYLRTRVVENGSQLTLDEGEKSYFVSEKGGTYYTRARVYIGVPTGGVYRADTTFSWYEHEPVRIE